MIVLGLDISGGYATAALLGEKLSAEVLKSQPTFEIQTNWQDLSQLMTLEFDIALMEPSGHHFEQVFITWLERHNKPFLYVNATRVAEWRKLNGLSKTDVIDALAIARYGLEYADQPKYFIPPCELPELRSLWLERSRLQQLSTKYINRIRKQLAHDFPERADTSLDRSWGKPIPQFLLWLAGQGESQYRLRYDRELHGGKINRNRKGKRFFEEVPGTCGQKPGRFLQFLSKQLLECETYALEIELEINSILEQEKFKPYMDAFQSVGFTNHVAAIYLTKVYPFQRFLGPDGRAIIERKPSQASGKICTYNRSLAQLKGCLGAGTMENTSGVRQKGGSKRTRWQKKMISQNNGQPVETPIGDRHCRTAFFLWQHFALFMGKMSECKYRDRVLAQYAKLKAKKKNQYLRAMNMQGYIAKLIFRELLESTSKSKSPVHYSRCFGYCPTQVAENQPIALALRSTITPDPAQH